MYADGANGPRKADGARCREEAAAVAAVPYASALRVETGGTSIVERKQGVGMGNGAGHKLFSLEVFRFGVHITPGAGDSQATQQPG